MTIMELSSSTTTTTAFPTSKTKSGLISTQLSSARISGQTASTLRMHTVQTSTPSTKRPWKSLPLKYHDPSHSLSSRSTQRMSSAGSGRIPNFGTITWAQDKTISSTTTLKNVSWIQGGWMAQHCSSWKTREPMVIPYVSSMCKGKLGHNSMVSHLGCTYYNRSISWLSIRTITLTVIVNRQRLWVFLTVGCWDRSRNFH